MRLAGSKEVPKWASLGLTLVAAAVLSACGGGGGGGGTADAQKVNTTPTITTPAAPAVSDLAAKLDRCPEASSGISGVLNYYKCMVGTYTGTVVGESGKSCSVTLTEDGMLSMKNGDVEVRPFSVLNDHLIYVKIAQPSIGVYSLSLSGAQNWLLENETSFEFDHNRSPYNERYLDIKQLNKNTELGAYVNSICRVSF